MIERNTIDEVYWRLARAPRGVDCSNSEVLSALGLLATTIMRTAYDDPAAEVERFCQVLRLAVKVSRGVAIRH
jgi:hypothetical protein